MTRPPYSQLLTLFFREAIVPLVQSLSITLSQPANRRKCFVASTVNRSPVGIDIVRPARRTLGLPPPIGTGSVPTRERCVASCLPGRPSLEFGIARSETKGFRVSNQVAT